MQFAHPWFLLFYVPLAAVVLYSLRQREPSVIIPSVRPFNESNPSKKMGLLSNIPPFLVITAVALMIFALAGPRKGIEELKQRTEGIDIIIMLDVSGSMQSIDIPENITTSAELKSALSKGKIKPRIDIAKDEIEKFVERRVNDRIGLIAFAPLPYVACPPTLDHAWLFEHLKRLEPGVIGDSTGIAGPISSAVYRLKNSEAKRKIAVLFTDGRNNINAKITPLQAAKLAKDFDVVIYTVGIGSKNAFVIQKGPFGSQWVQLRDEFDEKLLKDIAEISGGQYYAAKDAEGLQKTMREIDKLEKTSMEQPTFVEYKELAFPFINLSIILLVLAYVLGNTLFLRIP